MSATKLALGMVMLFGGAAVAQMDAPADDMEMKTPAPTTKPTTMPAGAYVCPMCHTSADKPGKCPDCGMDMKKADEVKKDKKMSTDDKPW